MNGTHRHRQGQVGLWTLVIFLLSGALLVSVAVSMWSSGSIAGVLTMAMFFVFFLASFTAMTIEVAGGELRM